MSVDASAMLEKNKSKVGERRAEMEWGVGDKIFSKGLCAEAQTRPHGLGLADLLINFKLVPHWRNPGSSITPVLQCARTRSPSHRHMSISSPYGGLGTFDGVKKTSVPVEVITTPGP